MKILVTGGCGFLGVNLAADAIIKNDKVTVIDNLSRMGSDRNLAWLRSIGDFTFIEGDIRDLSIISRTIKELKPDVIYHLAGQVALTTSIDNPVADFEANVCGTLNLLESVRRMHPESIIIYSSTNKVYGCLNDLEYYEEPTRYICSSMPYGFDESMPLSFSSPYGCSKGAADQYVLDYHATYGIRTIVFRHSTMYGSRQFATFDQGWIGWFCSKAVLIKTGDDKDGIQIAGNGKQVRDILNVEDIKVLYRCAIDNIAAAAGHAFNIGGGNHNSLSILELFKLLEVQLDIKIKHISGEPRPHDQKVFIADIAKATQLLGWSPSVDLPNGVNEMVGWILESRGIPTFGAFVNDSH